MSTPRSRPAPVLPSEGPLVPLGIDDVTIEGGFWGRLQDLNARTMISHCEQWMERLGWIGNFDAAVEGRLPHDRHGREFSDSDVYKLMEAMAWEIGRTGDKTLNARFEALVDRILPVQEPDGYLNTMFGRDGQGPRYSDLEWGHELYCFGHLLQAAVARGRTTGEDRFVEIARRAADHVCETFGDDGIQSVCGHPEIEPALVEFGRLTGESRYVHQAHLFVKRRGHGVLDDIEFGRAYFQDDEPLQEAEVLRGHAVRATYLAAGAIDVAVESHDDALLQAVRGQLETTVARRTYLTGGMGAHHEGESFGSDFELPSDRAYSETCAGIGSVMAHARLLLATDDVVYADVIERTLYNVLATSPREDGEAFFYTNTLHQRVPGRVPEADDVSPRAAASMRAPWFAVSCCPTNVARTIASLGAYVAAVKDDALRIFQYATGRISGQLSGGEVSVSVTTDYPHSGEIVVTVDTSLAAPWTLSMRVPAWAAEGATLTFANEERAVKPGLVELTREFAPGDRVVLHLPMDTRIIHPDPRIDALRGQVAFERGPLVMCVESVDVPWIERVDELRVPRHVVRRGEASLVPAMGTDGARADVVVPMISRRFSDEPWPFTPAREASAEPEERPVPLRPYHQWGNRGSSTMRVWVPVTELP